MGHPPFKDTGVDINTCPTPAAPPPLLAASTLANHSLSTPPIHQSNPQNITFHKRNIHSLLLPPNAERSASAANPSSALPADSDMPPSTPSIRSIQADCSAQQQPYDYDMYDISSPGLLYSSTHHHSKHSPHANKRETHTRSTHQIKPTHLCP